MAAKIEFVTKPRRTPEELAAYHQAKANAARAKAAKQARDLETRAKIVLGAAVINRTLKGFKWGEHQQLAGLRHFFGKEMTDRDWKAFEAWWTSKGHP